MDLAEVKDDPLYARARYWFVALLKERFRNDADHTLKRFHSLAKSFIEKEIDAKNLISEVHTLLKEHPHLISQFNHFVPQMTPVERSKRKYVVLDHKLHKNALQKGLDFANQVRRTLKEDDNEYEALVDIMTRFQQHQDIEQVKREASPLLRKHPGLEIELSKFLVATLVTRPKKPRNKDDIFSFYKDRGGGRDENRKHTNREKKLFGLEDKMYKSDMSFHAMVSASEAAERLVTENWGGDAEEKVVMRKYFSVLNVKCLKDLKLDGFLLHETEARKQVIRNAAIITSCLAVTLKGLAKDRENMKESVKKRMRLI